MDATTAYPLSDEEFERVAEYEDAHYLEREARRARMAEAELQERVRMLTGLLEKSLEGLEYLWRDAQPRSYARGFMAEVRAALEKAEG